MVIDLLRGDRFGLVRQKYAQQQQETLVAINHTYRKWRKKKRKTEVTDGMRECAAPQYGATQTGTQPK